MAIDVYPLATEGRAVAEELQRLAFGAPRPPADHRDRDAGVPAAQTAWGVYDSGRLAATAEDREQEHWFGGCLVPASGVAGVAVAAADRGRGHAKALLTVMLAAARTRGAAIATLFPTAPALYRGLGWEQPGALTWSELSPTALTGCRLPTGVTLRAADAGDSAAIRTLYTEVARAGSGYLERSGPLFPQQPVDALDGVTLAVDTDGAVQGYIGWDRSGGYRGEGRLTVYDAIGRSGPAVEALLAALGTWAAVVTTLRLRLPDPDPVQWLLPTVVPQVRTVQPWMLRLVDAPRAVAARGWPAALHTGVDLDIVDAQCPWNAGRHRLEVRGGSGRLTPGGTGSITIGARGLALLYAGGVTVPILRRAGLISGGRAHDDDALNALMAGPRPALLDYF